MTTLLAATRPTRRDAIKHPWRSIAAILLVAVPMFLVSFMITDNNSAGSISYLPTAQAQVSSEGENAQTLLDDNLPEGFHAELYINGIAEVTNNDSLTQALVVQTPRINQVSVPSSILDSVGAKIGDTISIDGYSVTVQALSPASVLIPEGVLFSPDTFQNTEVFYGTWSIFGPREFTEDDATALREVGFDVSLRNATTSPSYSAQSFTFYVLSLMPFVILAVIALMLISPVFTISAARQTRNFALLASQGATPRHIRWAVLVYGVFAGVVGASLGLILGLIGVFGWWAYTYPEFSLTVPWAILAAFWVLAVVASTVAAFLPAVFISRTSIINGIQGGASDKIIKWSPLMLIGPFFFALAGLVALVSGEGTWGGVVKQLSFLTAVIALPASVPAVLWALGRLPGLTFKLATRDMLRRSMHSIPAIGALAAAIMWGTFIQTFDKADQESTQEAYESVYPETVFIRGDAQIPGVMGQKISVLGSRTIDVHPLETNFNITQTPQSLEAVFNASLVVATPEILDMFGISENAEIYVPSTLTSGQREFDVYPEGQSHTFTTVAVLPALYPHVLISPEAFASIGGQEEFLGTIVAPDSLDNKVLSEIAESDAAQLSWDPYGVKRALQFNAVLTILVIIVISLVLVLSNRKYQHDTLVAVGADPGTIRKVNALNAALLALVGGVMGIVSGWIAALLSGTTDQIVDGTILEYGTLEHMMLPWPLLVSLLVVAPLVCAVIGAIASPSGRHQEASI